MEYIDFKKEAIELIDKIAEIRKLMALEQKSEEMRALEAQMNVPDFWNDQNLARKISKRVSQIREEIAHINRLEATKDELETYLTFLDDEFSQELFEEAVGMLPRIRQFTEKAEIEALLNDKYDHNDALFTIQKNLKETPLKTGSNTFHVSFSYGLSAFESGDKFEKVYANADEKMYKAKSTKAHYRGRGKK